MTSTDSPHNPLVSIIVPVYNGDRYLRACIHSVQAQTYPTWEMLLVDDGSTDASGSLCDAFAAEDSRIRVFHRENGGVSAARNTGLDAVQGEFVAFLDADDVMPYDALASRLDLIEGADLALARYGAFADIPATADSPEERLVLLPGAEELGRVLYITPETKVFQWDRRETVIGVMLSGELGYQGRLSNKLFRTRIIAENGLRFDEDLAYNEDRLFCTAYALHCDSTHLGNQLVDWYRNNPDGTMGELKGMSDARLDRILSEFVAYDRMVTLVQKDFPNLAYYTAGDAMWRASALKKSVPDTAPQLAQALGERIASFGRMALKAPSGMFSPVKKAKILAHALLKR